jgi:hypothetical protein
MQIRLPHKDWFHLHPNKKSHFALTRMFTYDEFIINAKKEIVNHITKELRKEKTFIKQFNNKFKDIILLIEEQLGDVQTIITKDKFAKICTKAREAGEAQELTESNESDEADETAKAPGYYPLLTFHGTSSTDVVNSIIKYGYLLPYDIHPGTGEITNMSNGNYYGDGIYTSTKFYTSRWYSFTDFKWCTQLLVNFVMVGDVDFIPVNPKNINDYNKFGDRGLIIPHPKTHRYSYNNMNYDTRALPDLNVVVSSSGNNVIPLFLVTSGDKHKEEALLIKDSKNKLIEYDRFNFNEDDNRSVVFNRIVDSYHTIQLPKTFGVKSKRTFHHHLIASTNMIKTNMIKNSLIEFIGGLNDNKKLYLYDDQNKLKHKVLNISSEYDVNNIKIKTQSTKRNNILPALDKVLDNITKQDPNLVLINVIYLFIHKIGTYEEQKDAYDNLIQKYGKMILVKNTVIKLIYFKQVNIKQVDYGAYKIKQTFQTLDLWEKYTHTFGELSVIYDEQENIKINRINYKVSYPYGVIGTGFILAMDENPYWDVNSAVSMYKGNGLQYMSLNNEIYWVKYTNYFDVKSSCDGLLRLLCRFRNKIMFDKEGHDKYNVIINKLCSSVIKKLTERAVYINCEINKDHKVQTIKFERLLTEKSEELYKLFQVFDLKPGHEIIQQQRDKIIKDYRLNPINDKVKVHILMKNNKFKTKKEYDIDQIQTLIRLILRQQLEERTVIKTFYYKLLTVMSDMKTFSGVEFDGKWFNRLQNMKYSKSIVKRSKHKFGKQSEDYLMLSRYSNYGIKVIRTAASEVEPWLIMVDDFSNDVFSVKQIYNQYESQNKSQNQHGILDQYGKLVTDVMITTNKTDLDKMYLGYLFTRNPHLYMSSQKIALMTVAFVRLIEKIFIDKQNKLCNKALCNKALELLEHIKILNGQNDQIKELFDDIVNNDNFESYLTETNSVASVCKILGGLTVQAVREKLYENKKKYSRFAFALLAESIMRSCKALIRIQKKDGNTMIQSILGLSKKTDLDNYKFDMKRCMKYTNRIIKKRYTNCSPFAVVAVLEFLANDNDFDSFSKNASMKSFLDKHLPDQEGDVTQVALYLQGLKYNKSKYRQDIKFDDPETIINDIVKEQVTLVRNKQNMLKYMSDKRNTRYIKRLGAAQEYKIYHTAPKIFNYKLIADMNGKRPLDDQLELTQSGLLKHHCCYPNCPDYLTNFCTAKDRRLTGKYRYDKNDRQGLMHHLRHNHLNNNYVPSFHLIATSIMKKNRGIEYDVFVNKVRERIYDDERILKFYNKLEDKELQLKSVYDHYNLFALQ